MMRSCVDAHQCCHVHPAGAERPGEQGTTACRQLMGIVTWTVVGVIAGFVANLLMGSRGPHTVDLMCLHCGCMRAGAGTIAVRR